MVKNMSYTAVLRPPHPVELVACDMDGTLLNDDFVLTPATKRAVARLTRNGVRVVLVSGRMKATLLPFHGELGLTEPIICYNGALLWDVASGQPIEHTPIEHDVAGEVISFAESERLHLQYFWDDRFWARERNSWMELYEGRLRMQGHLVADLREFGPDRPATKLQLITDPARVPGLVELLNGRFDGRLYATRTLPEYVELMHPAVSKGRALRRVANALGVPLEHTMVFGDSQNDQTMFAVAGFAVAMGNARADVRESASLVTLSNEEDGVARALEALGLLD
jgi:Cof subfamily protein (haloacid dehalogenase superfamily)